MLGKEDAISKLEEQIDEISEIKKYERFSPQYKKWKRDTEVAIENIFGSDTRHLDDFQSIRYSLMAFSTGTPDSKFQRRFIKGLDNAEQVLSSLIDEIEEYWEDNPDGQRPGVFSRVEHICDRFHGISRRLRNRYDNRQTIEVEDEYDVQDLMHALLTLDFEDIRREEWTPSYAGGSARLDFLLKNHSIVIEVKKTRKGLGEKQVGDQLLVDIGRYQVHENCTSLICFVYDPEGRIGNPTGLESDLSGERDGLNVKAIIAPKNF